MIRNEIIAGIILIILGVYIIAIYPVSSIFIHIIGLLFLIPGIIGVLYGIFVKEPL